MADTKSTVLTLLREAPDYLSGQRLSERLGVSRAAVWKAVEALRQEGYAIDSVPNRGYRLLQATTRLNEREILSFLPAGHPWRGQIFCFDSVDSTNDRAKAMAASGAPHGTVLIAEAQTGGRGRRGRSFFSPPGMSVYLSVILRPEAMPAQLMHLTCATAEAMCQAIQEAAGFRPGIKWANDLVCGGKKLVGILTELSVEAESGQIQYAVIGIGINCLQTEADFPPELRPVAGSLAMFAKKTPNRNALAAAMIRALSAMDTALLSEKQAIMDAYRRDCVTLGQTVSVVQPDGVRHGQALDVDGEGALTVRFSDGSTEKINSGEVSVRGMYGYV